MPLESLFKKYKNLSLLFAEYGEFVAFLVEFIEEYGLVEEFETWLTKKAEKAGKNEES